MNTARLKGLIEELLRAEEELKVQQLLTKLANALVNLAGNPQDSNMQVEVSNRLHGLGNVIDKLRGKWEPAQLEDLRSIGALTFFGDELFRDLQKSIAENYMTPAVAQKQAQQLLKDRSQYLELIKSTDNDLNALGIGSDPLDEGTAEIGFRIPRELFDNELEGLIDELRVLRRIMRAFSEVTVGSAEPIHVKQISTSDPLFFFGLDPRTVAGIGAVVTWILVAWGQIENIRKARAETKKANAFSEDELKGFFGNRIEETIKSEIDKQAKELVGSERPTGRKAEQYTDLKWSLESLFARIERGMTVELRFLPPPAPETDEDGQGPKGKSLQAAFEQMKNIAPELSFPEAEADPLIQLPSKYPPGRTEGDGSKAEKDAEAGAKPKKKLAND